MAPPGSPWYEFTVVIFLGPCTRGVGQGPVALMSSDMVEARDLSRGLCGGRVLEGSGGNCSRGLGLQGNPPQDRDPTFGMYPWDTVNLKKVVEG